VKSPPNFTRPKSADPDSGVMPTAGAATTVHAGQGAGGRKKGKAKQPRNATCVAVSASPWWWPVTRRRCPPRPFALVGSVLFVLIQGPKPLRSHFALHRGLFFLLGTVVGCFPASLSMPTWDLFPAPVAVRRPGEERVVYP
jgi:hypothetical protein